MRSSEGGGSSLAAAEQQAHPVTRCLGILASVLIRNYKASGNCLGYCAREPRRGALGEMVLRVGGELPEQETCREGPCLPEGWNRGLEAHGIPGVSPP